MAELDMSGDSITAGYGVTAAQKYATLLGNSLGLPVVNRGVNGAMAGDQSHAAAGVARQADDIATIMVGTNDERVNGTNTTKRGYFVESLRRLMIDAACHYKEPARGPNMTRTGSWSNTQVNSIGVNSNVQGSKITYVTYGTAVYIGYIIQNNAACAGALMEVKVDGVIKGYISCDGTGGSTTANGLTYPAACYRVGGLSNAGHTVEVTVVSSGKYCYVDFIHGNSGQNGAKTFISNIIRMTPAGYAAYGGSDANVQDYNAYINAIVNEGIADGLKVKLVDNYSTVNPNTMLLSDGIHPNATGHQTIANTFYNQINVPVPVVTYMPTSWGTQLKITTLSGVVTAYSEV